MNKNSHCEVQRGDGRWESISVEEAKALGSLEIKRCPQCHGRVSAHKAGGKTPAHFEHLPKHNGCRLSHRFDGNVRPHPFPIE
jgi:hypothetical protein